MTININELTLGQIKEISALFGGKQEEGFNPFTIGKSYLIRTVTHISVGRVKAVGKNELVLENASWVADTGRFHDALKDGLEKLSSSEIEPFVNDVILGRGAIVDATEYTNELPRSQK